ncbi:lipoyl domain-containing protein [Zavarzinia compransoris]|uniref:Biotin attachment protein n=1 Tax=Zavarzinia compransoris TaxID=1264899 RepID=A0A317E4Z5_9PROT|nr:lipoyl domain-containing protein [Zavarzinia compransoris]PWR21642.1 biotin attachment protein [Zavarzinia compransoris]TDP45577.1 biotin-dependent enzyme [Zavarzinia compransoris]
MKIRVKVPKLGLTIEEVILASWDKPQGATVAVDDVIATVEADKANYEIYAPAPGRLTVQLVEQGATVAVGAELAIIET